MKVFLSDDKSSFTMQGRIWTQTFKVLCPNTANALSNGPFGG